MSSRSSLGRSQSLSRAAAANKGKPNEPNSTVEIRRSRASFNFKSNTVLQVKLFSRFEIVSDNDLDQPLVGSSPDECHSKLLLAISPSLRSIITKGADFFGISHPTIQNLVQSTPGTRKLAMYKQQRFEVCDSKISSVHVQFHYQNLPSLYCLGKQKSNDRKRHESSNGRRNRSRTWVCRSA